jgi:four helix bundle protein
MPEPSIIKTKSYSFALNIVSLYKDLTNRKEYVLSKQILRSGTSIGANVHEAIAAETKKDFVHKLSIALKEARERCIGFLF